MATVNVSADRPENFELSALYFRQLLQSVQFDNKEQDFDDVIKLLVVAEISNLFHRRNLAISQLFFKISGSNFFCELIESSFRQLDV